jgi:hypothetical protein
VTEKKLCKGCGKFYDEAIAYLALAHASHGTSGRIGVVIHEGQETTGSGRQIEDDN